MKGTNDKFKAKSLKRPVFWHLEKHLRKEKDPDCAAEDIFYCPTMNSHRPKS